MNASLSHRWVVGYCECFSPASGRRDVINPERQGLCGNYNKNPLSNGVGFKGYRHFIKPDSFDRRVWRRPRRG